jgi:hypothetical protein
MRHSFPEAARRQAWVPWDCDSNSADEIYFNNRAHNSLWITFGQTLKFDGERVFGLAIEFTFC